MSKSTEYIVSFKSYDPYQPLPLQRSFEGEAPAKIYARERVSLGYIDVKLTKVVEEEIPFYGNLREKVR